VAIVVVGTQILPAVCTEQSAVDDSPPEQLHVVVVRVAVVVLVGGKQVHVLPHGQLQRPFQLIHGVVPVVVVVVVVVGVVVLVLVGGGHEQVLPHGQSQRPFQLIHGVLSVVVVVVVVVSKGGVLQS